MTDEERARDVAGRAYAYAEHNDRGWLTGVLLSHFGIIRSEATAAVEQRLRDLEAEVEACEEIDALVRNKTGLTEMVEALEARLAVATRNALEQAAQHLESAAERISGTGRRRDPRHVLREQVAEIRALADKETSDD